MTADAVSLLCSFFCWSFWHDRWCKIILKHAHAIWLTHEKQAAGWCRNGRLSTCRTATDTQANYCTASWTVSEALMGLKITLCKCESAGCSLNDSSNSTQANTQTFSLGLYVREGNESVSVSSSCAEEASRIEHHNYTLQDLWTTWQLSETGFLINSVMKLK